MIKQHLAVWSYEAVLEQWADVYDGSPADWFFEWPALDLPCTVEGPCNDCYFLNGDYEMLPFGG